jgi:hypothetical protein
MDNFKSNQQINLSKGRNKLTLINAPWRMDDMCQETNLFWVQVPLVIMVGNLISLFTTYQLVR